MKNFKKRNNSVGENKAGLASFNVDLTDRKERSAGITESERLTANYIDLKTSSRLPLNAAKKSSHQSKKDLIGFLMGGEGEEKSSGNKPAKTLYNPLNLKFSQLQEKANLAWKTEKCTKNYSIKKNTHDWLLLKERLSQTKQKACIQNYQEESIPESPSRVSQPRMNKIEILSEASKLERDASRWLGEDSRPKTYEDFKRLLSLIKTGPDLTRRAFTKEKDNMRGNQLVWDAWKV